MSKRVLLGNMSCFADVGDPNQRYQKFLKNGVGPFKCFIESLILFDRIVIPTNDFMPLALLAGVFGEKEIAELLDLEIVKFARFRGLVTYVGNGGGILVAQIHSGDERKPRWMSAPLEEAARIAIEGLDANIDKIYLRKVAVKSSVEFPVEEKQGEFAKLVYDEIAKEPSILAAEGLIDLNRLPGVKPTDVRVLSGSYVSDQTDDVFQALRVAQACIEAKAAIITSCDDIYTSDQVGQLFEFGIARLAKEQNPVENYAKLIELGDLPDIGDLVLRHKPIFTDVLKLRNSRSGREFRAWFHQNCRSNPRATTKEYISLLRTVPSIQSATAKTLRFFTQVGVSAATMPFAPVVGLVAGASAGAIDTYLTERIFKGANPKVFLERLSAFSKSVPKA